MTSEVLYNKVIDENSEKAFQVRLVVTDFREIEYLQLRKYFLSYEGEWVPSQEGVSVPLTINNVQALLDGLLEIASKAEGNEILRKYAAST